MNGEEKEPKICSFCGRSSDEVENMVTGPGVYICSECIDICHNILLEERKNKAKQGKEPADTKVPTPEEIKEYIDQYVIEQDNAKIALAVAVYNHYKRLFFKGEDDGVELQKSNIILLGPTGSGKTLLAQTLARYLDVPFAISDATTLTQAGYVGDDVENILLRLIQAADYDIEILEGTVANVPPQGGRKHPNQEMIQIDTSNILFICGGAFAGLDKVIDSRLTKSVMGFGADIEKAEDKDMDELLQQVQPEDLLKFGLIPEFIGRLPVIVALHPLKEEALVKILTEPKNALVKQYKKLLAMDGVELVIEDAAIHAIARQAIERNTGARGLRAIIEKIMQKVMYEIPGMKDVVKCTITEDNVVNHTDPLLERKAAEK